MWEQQTFKYIVSKRGCRTTTASFLRSQCSSVDKETSFSLKFHMRTNFQGCFSLFFCYTAFGYICDDVVQDETLFYLKSFHFTHKSEFYFLMCFHLTTSTLCASSSLASHLLSQPTLSDGGEERKNERKPIQQSNNKFFLPFNATPSCASQWIMEHQRTERWKMFVGMRKFN